MTTVLDNDTMGLGCDEPPVFIYHLAAPPTFDKALCGKHRNRPIDLTLPNRPNTEVCVVCDGLSRKRRV